MSKPKGESASDKAARERERRITESERTRTAERSASDLATDLNAIYGLRQIAGFGRTAAR